MQCQLVLLEGFCLLVAITLCRLGREFSPDTHLSWRLRIKGPSKLHPDGYFSCDACYDATRRAHYPFAYKY